MSRRRGHARPDDPRLVVGGHRHCLIEEADRLCVEGRVAALPRLLKVRGTQSVDSGEVVWLGGKSLLKLKDRAVGGRLDGRRPLAVLVLGARDEACEREEPHHAGQHQEGRCDRCDPVHARHRKNPRWGRGRRGGRPLPEFCASLGLASARRGWRAGRRRRWPKGGRTGPCRPSLH